MPWIQYPYTYVVVTQHDSFGWPSGTRLRWRGKEGSEREGRGEGSEKEGVISDLCLCECVMKC